MPGAGAAGSHPLPMLHQQAGTGLVELNIFNLSLQFMH
jgi:hypothetical protein